MLALRSGGGVTNYVFDDPDLYPRLLDKANEARERFTSQITSRSQGQAGCLDHDLGKLYRSGAANGRIEDSSTLALVSIKRDHDSDATCFRLHLRKAQTGLQASGP